MFELAMTNGAVAAFGQKEEVLRKVLRPNVVPVIKAGSRTNVRRPRRERQRPSRERPGARRRKPAIWLICASGGLGFHEFGRSIEVRSEVERGEVGIESPFL
jgi:hypothetical protein